MRRGITHGNDIGTVTAGVAQRSHGMAESRPRVRIEHVIERSQGRQPDADPIGAPDILMRTDIVRIRTNDKLGDAEPNRFGSGPERAGAPSLRAPRLVPPAWTISLYPPAPCRP